MALKVVHNHPPPPPRRDVVFVPVVLLSALAAATLARPDIPPPSYGAPAPSYHAPAPSYHAPAPEAPPKYDYNYAVKDEYSGNDFGAQEARDGYDTQGSYYVQLPDGRLQRVTYTVNGDSGFVAEVTYEGEAHLQNAPSLHTLSRTAMIECDMQGSSWLEQQCTGHRQMWQYITRDTACRDVRRPGDFSLSLVTVHSYWKIVV
ncbi:hypothetical protein O3P69_014734 [Scylla paramamosain]|uniref:Pro-resilin n=1 Tax=Scylla paramamosain TaxID=85552 RepID=A0AAW0U0U7_SCYPA